MQVKESIHGADSFIFYLLGLGVFLLAVFWLPSFHNPYINSKWTVFYTLTAFLGLGLVFTKKLGLPNLPKILWVGIGCFYFFYTASLIANSHDLYLTEIRDHLTFLILTFLGIQAAKKREFFLQMLTMTFQLTTVLVILVAILQYYNISIKPFVFPHKNLFSTFGNKNMAGEFVAISCLIQFLYLLDIWNKKNWIKLFSLCLLACSLIYLSVLWAKAAILGLIVAAIFPFILKSKIKNRLLFGVGVFGVIGFLSLFAIVNLHNEESSLALRFIRWGNTIQLMLDRPFGIGPDNFSFDYIPYKSAFMNDIEFSEKFVVKSPHNGFLEMGAELGLFTLLSFLFILGNIFWKSIKLKPKSHWLYYVPESVLVLILVDAVFAFPMELVIPSWMAPVMLGLLLAEIFTIKTAGKSVTLGIKSVSLLVAIFMIPAVIAHTMAARPASLEQMETACKMLPTEWAYCLKYAEEVSKKDGLPGKASFALRHRNLMEAKNIINQTLKYDPRNFAAIVRLAYIERELKQKRKACEAFNSYTTLVGPDNFLTKSGWSKYCSTR